MFCKVWILFPQKLIWIPKLRGLSAIPERFAMFSDVRTYWSPEACERASGYKVDGKALENGARVVITDNKKYATKSRVYVSDARRALALCAKNFYGNPTRDMKVIGITGTNGKTSVSVMLKNIF